ncbi:hypothetical protein HMPREF9120_00814 [Neisseria sp. oral taxon 020 str. F0370]|nr:hypothetical protein HMPREF9120_00814 [Neisseria sp. oral taxon 020 str. F0370]
MRTGVKGKPIVASFGGSGRFPSGKTAFLQKKRRRAATFQTASFPLQSPALPSFSH